MTTATCRVTFGQASAANAFSVIELDDTLNLDEDGKAKSSFAAGETIWFLLHLQPGSVPGNIYQTDGMVTYCGRCTRLRNQDALWTPEQTSVDLSYYPSGEVNLDWQGNELPLGPVSGRSLPATESDLDTMALAKMSYPVDFFLFRFDPPADLQLDEDEEYQIQSMITVETSA